MLALSTVRAREYLRPVFVDCNQKVFVGFTISGRSPNPLCAFWWDLLSGEVRCYRGRLGHHCRFVCKHSVSNQPVFLGSTTNSPGYMPSSAKFCCPTVLCSVMYARTEYEQVFAPQATQDASSTFILLHSRRKGIFLHPEIMLRNSFFEPNTLCAPLQTIF